MLKNNIKIILEEQGLSVNKLSKEIGLTYHATHSLVNRKYLNETKMINIVKVAKVLNVKIDELFTIEKME